MLQNHTKQTHCVDCGQQNVVSQHAKRFPSPTSPSIHGTAKDPNRIKSKKRWRGHCERHSNTATNTNSPCKKLNNKANSVRLKVISYPNKCVKQYIVHRPVHWLDFYLWLRIEYQIGQQRSMPNQSQPNSNRSHCGLAVFVFYSPGLTMRPCPATQ